MRGPPRLPRGAAQTRRPLLLTRRTRRVRGHGPRARARTRRDRRGYLLRRCRRLSAAPTCAASCARIRIEFRRTARRQNAETNSRRRTMPVTATSGWGRLHDERREPDAGMDERRSLGDPFARQRARLPECARRSPDRDADERGAERREEEHRRANRFRRDRAARRDRTPVQPQRPPARLRRRTGASLRTTEDRRRGTGLRAPAPARPAGAAGSRGAPG